MHISSQGYLILDFYDNEKKIYISEHRLNALINNSLHSVLNNVVHHKNGCKLDNRLENLELMNWGEHNRLHHTGATHSLEARKKMKEAKVGNKARFNPCINIRKQKANPYKQGFIWVARPYSDGKIKCLSSVDLEKCKEKVEDFINSERNNLNYTTYKVIEGD